MNNNEGPLLSFVQLLQHDEVKKILIPIIQRDYAQGRPQVKDIRERFVASLKYALESNKPLTLDCVYGSKKDRNFIPIDGQQRLTTLFLLHYYISAAAGRLGLEPNLLKKFTYMVRDSAKEFCESLATKSIDISDKPPSVTIKNAQWYHGGVFDYDPTIAGMLTMLDEIHKQFGTSNAVDYYHKLFGSDSPIKFYWLSIDDNFGAADDLFIKINARGKALTRFEMFKAEFETAITKSCDPDIVNDWKYEIDNDWLEIFWKYFEKDAPNNAENGLFRYIVFIGDTFYSQQEKSVFNSKNISEDSDKIQYENTIKVLQHPDNLAFLRKSFKTLEQLICSNMFSDCKEIFKSLVFGNNLEFWEYAKLFAIIDFSVKFGLNDRIFPQFIRVLKNLLASQRGINMRDMVFSTSIERTRYHSFTKGIDELLDQMTAHNGDILKTLQAGRSIGGLTGHSSEVEKARFMSRFGEKDILALEEIDELCGLIHNFIESDRILISADKLLQVIKCNKMIFLQLLQSYSPPNEMLLLRVSNLWLRWFGEDKGFRRHRMWFNSSKYGDFLLTAAPGDTKKWQQPLKALISDLAAMPYNNIENEMAELLQRRVASLNFSHWYDYLVKYTEFFSSDGYCYCMIPEYKDGTGYWCLVSDKNWGNFYNPFCMSLARKLNIPSPIDSDNSDIFSGDIKNILIIPNGISAEIMSDGSWRINSEGNSTEVKVAAGEDCIEQAFNYLTGHFDLTFLK